MRHAVSVHQTILLDSYLHNHLTRSGSIIFQLLQENFFLDCRNLVLVQEQDFLKQSNVAKVCNLVIHNLQDRLYPNLQCLYLKFQVLQAHATMYFYQNHFDPKRILFLHEKQKKRYLQFHENLCLQYIFLLRDLF